MSWTYGNLPASVPRDAVRFLIQDTDTSRQLVTDEEIAFLLATEANVYMAAAMACEMVANRNAGIQSKSVGDLSITYGGSAHFMALCLRLRRRGQTHQGLYAGGLSEAERLSDAADSDLREPFFRDGLTDTPSQNPLVSPS